MPEIASASIVRVDPPAPNQREMAHSVLAD